MKLAIAICVASCGLAASAADLHHNGPFVTGAGAGAGGADVSLVQDSLGSQVYGYTCQAIPAANRLADDFTVPAGGWTVDSLVLYCFQAGAASNAPTINHVNLRIWSGRPGDAGATVIFGDTTTNRFQSAAWTGSYRVLQSSPMSTNRAVYAVTAALPPTFLAPGTYWLDWQVSGTLTSGPFTVPVTIMGLTGAPGANARAFLGPSGPWMLIRESGTNAAQELAFIVRGTAGGGGGPVCYANCDGGTTQPCLNVQDFGCYLNLFASGDSRANCDGSTTTPVLNVQDFSCFLNRFAAGCSSC